MRRQLAALFVVALVAVAGCAGGSAPGADGDASSDDPVYETPLDAGAVADAHVDALGDAGSYTIESDAASTVASQNQTTETTGEVRGDMATGAVFTRTETSQRTIELYAGSDGATYRRSVAGDQTRYRNVSGQAVNASEYARSTVSSFVNLFEFSYAGTEDADGGTVHVYEADGAAAMNTSSPGFAQLNESNVDAASATLHVRDDGVVTMAGYDITITFQGQTQSIDTAQRFTAIGETDVTEPDWLSEAASNTSSSSQ